MRISCYFLLDSLPLFFVKKSPDPLFQLSLAFIADQKNACGAVCPAYDGYILCSFSHVSVLLSISLISDTAGSVNSPFPKRHQK